MAKIAASGNSPQTLNETDAFWVTQKPYTLNLHRGTSRIRDSPPPCDNHSTQGMGLLQGPTGGVCLMIEVPLHL